MRWSFGCLLLLTALPARATGEQAPARQEKAALRWLRADNARSCPSEADVKLAIEQRLGAGAFVSPEQSSLLVEVQLDGRAHGGFHAEIAMLRGQDVVGRRELVSEDGSCQGLAETAALVIALAIDPEASLEPLPLVAAAQPLPAAAEPPPSEPRAPAPEPRTASRAPAPAPRAPAPRAEPQDPGPAAAPRQLPPPPWHAELELSFGIATGSVPSVAGGVQLRGRALPPRLPFGVELQAGYFPERRLEAAPGKGAGFRVFYAGVGLCSRASRSSRLAAVGCGGAEVRTVAGQGYGFDVTPRFQARTLALAARGALWFRVRPPFAVVMGPSLSVPLKRDHFETTSAGETHELFRMRRLGWGFDLGAVWEL